MKFQIELQNVCGVSMRGLRLLDAVREHIHNIEPEQVVDQAYLGYCETVALTEAVARASGQFEDQNSHLVCVNAKEKDWLELHRVIGVESTDSGKLSPVFKFDSQPLIEAWAKQGYPVGKRIQYPFVEQAE